MARRNEARRIEEDRPDTGKEAGRGREAESPRDIPKRGWKDILLRVKNEVSDDNMSIVAAGVAFYVLLGLIPSLAAMIGIYGWVTDPATLERQINQLSDVMPQDAHSILSSQLSRLTQDTGASGAVAIGGILLALWSGSKSMKAMIGALNIAYDEDEKRGFFKVNLLAVGLTLAGIVGGIVIIGLLAVLPGLLDNFGLGQAGQTAVNILRWPVLIALAAVSIAVLYRFAPSRDEPRWRWVSWGSVIATGLWLLGSIAFSVYVSNFGSYNETYGSLGAVVILLMWFYISAFSVLLGAEINSEMEHQTRKDTTEGHPQPMGTRGAHMADTVGRIHRKK